MRALSHLMNGMSMIRSPLRRIILLSILLCGSGAYGQDPEQIMDAYLGVGTGQDVGGIIGARLTYWPVPYLSAFIGGGWAWVGAGYNVGMELRVPTKSRISPFIVGMYGYNAVVRIEGKEDLNGIYQGPTAGFGVLLKKHHTRNYWRFSMNIPFRSQEMMDDWSSIKARPDVEVEQDLLPFTIGVGLHLGL